MVLLSVFVCFICFFLFPFFFFGGGGGWWIVPLVAWTCVLCVCYFYWVAFFLSLFSFIHFCCCCCCCCFHLCLYLIGGVWGRGGSPISPVLIQMRSLHMEPSFTSNIAMIPPQSGSTYFQSTAGNNSRQHFMDLLTAHQTSPLLGTIRGAGRRASSN